MVNEVLLPTKNCRSRSFFVEIEGGRPNRAGVLFHILKSARDDAPLDVKTRKFQIVVM